MQGKNKPTLPLPLTSSNKQLLKMGVLNSWEKRMLRSLHHYLKHLASSVTVQTEVVTLQTDISDFPR